LQRIPKRVYCRRYIEVGSIGKALEAVARLSPAFFLRLADDLREAKPDQAPEAPARDRIELAG